MNSITYFEIQASNPPALVKFYSSIFNWHFARVDGLPIEYYHISNAGINGGLLQRPMKVPPMEYGTNAFTNSIEVENFDATAKLILEHGGTIAMEKFAIPGKCWQGYFLDTDNNVFGLVQVDPNAK
ncbi:MAG TPA: VOC family protein [Candidatus Paceibacterota bacterium]|nr:VOC family protein [Candidatus Paceibacterota bacterium]